MPQDAALPDAFADARGDLRAVAIGRDSVELIALDRRVKRDGAAVAVMEIAGDVMIAVATSEGFATDDAVAGWGRSVGEVVDVIGTQAGAGDGTLQQSGAMWFVRGEQAVTTLLLRPAMVTAAMSFAEPVAMIVGSDLAIVADLDGGAGPAHLAASVERGWTDDRLLVAAHALVVRGGRWLMHADDALGAVVARQRALAAALEGPLRDRLREAAGGQEAADAVLQSVPDSGTRTSGPSMRPRDEIVGSWRELAASGDSISVPLDRALVERHRRGNRSVLAVATAVAGAAAVAAVPLGVAFRPWTGILVGVFAVVAAIVAVQALLVRRRMTAIAASGETFVHANARGITIGGEVVVPWDLVTGGVGFDGTDAVAPRGQRIAAAALGRSGVARSELLVGVRGARRLRDAAPAAMRGLFEVIDDRGGVRLPLDVAVGGEDVLAVLWAVWAFGERAGVEVLLTSDPQQGSRAVTNVLLGKPPTAS